MGIFDFTFVKKKSKEIPEWILDEQNNIMRATTDKTYSYSYSYGDAKYDLKESHSTYTLSEYCDKLQLVRYEWYDRYGAQYGKTLEGANLWLEQKYLPAPHEHLEKLLDNAYPSEYGNICSRFSMEYDEYLVWRLNNPPQNLYFILRNFCIWVLKLLFLMLPIGMYLIVDSFIDLEEPGLNLNLLIYVLIAFITTSILYMILKDYRRSRLRLRNNSYGVPFIFVPYIIYFISVIVLF